MKRRILAPVIPVMAWLGWRAAFWLLGGLGIIWAVVWYVMYKDPQKVSGSKFQVSSSEETKPKLPWNKILHNRQFWTICAMYFFYAFGSWFFFSWFPTFMELGRGFAKSELTYAVAVPFIMSMIGNITGSW